MSVPPPPLIIITHEFFPRRGGIATYTEEIARAAATSGREVEVWAQKANGAEEKPWPFRLRRMPLKGTHGLICQLRLAREMIRHRHTLRRATVYLPEPGPILTLMWLQLIGPFRPPKIVITFHGSEILRFHRNPLSRFLARRLFHHARRLSTLTEYTRGLLHRHFPGCSDQAVLAPGALRSDFGNDTPQTRSPNGKLIILTVGRLHPRKGQRETMQALQSLPTELRAQIEYWIVGAEPKQNYDAQLRALAGESDLSVRFLGDISDEKLGSVYAQADIFALTSVPHRQSIEGFGLVYLEASAHGLPIVAHAIGGVTEAVINEQTGLLIPPHAPHELTAAFARLISDQSLREQMGATGRVWAHRQNWRQSAAILFSDL